MNLKGSLMKLLIMLTTWLVVSGEDGAGSAAAAAAVTFSKSNAVTHVDMSGEKQQTVFISRQKRQTSDDLTAAEKLAILDHHNTLRRAQGASNMEEMAWNDVLADMGREWAEGCNWAHGQPANPDSPYPSLGQNLYQKSGGSRPDMVSAVQLWYDETFGYEYDTNTCHISACGHYTQVVWDRSREVGCGFHQCANFPDYFLVCNYGPAGNFPRQPFVKGAPCSKCTSGHQWCHDGLCQAECSAEGPRCSCEVECQNCGTLNTAECQCACTDGWGPGDCSEVCRDLDTTCGNGWPSFWCGEADYPWVDENCFALCGYCVAADPPTDPAICATDPPTTPAPIVTPTPSPPSLCECAVDYKYRTNCPGTRRGTTKSECDTAHGCWERKRKVPNCYSPDGEAKAQIQTCRPRADLRGEGTAISNCGWKGIKKDQCLCTGCCWDSSDRKGAWCYTFSDIA